MVLSSPFHRLNLFELYAQNNGGLTASVALVQTTSWKPARIALAEWPDALILRTLDETSCDPFELLSRLNQQAPFRYTNGYPLAGVASPNVHYVKVIG